MRVAEGGNGCGPALHRRDEALLAHHDVHPVAVLGFPGKAQRNLRLTPDRVEGIVPHEEARNSLEHAVACEGQITHLGRGAMARAHEIDRGRDRLRPEGNRSNRVIDLSLIRDKPLLLDKVAGESRKAMAIAVTVKDRSENKPEIGIGVRRSATRPMPHADIHHAADVQAIQMEVCKVRGGDKDCQHLHGGLKFRIGH